MPELPEVEHLRRTLEERLVGTRIDAVRRGTFDVLDRSAYRTRASVDRMLLAAGTVTELRRRGKNLALLTDDGRVLGMHLGMSGRVTFTPPDADDRHAHVSWRFSSGTKTQGWMTFRDPRRFGGLTALPSAEALADHWSELGPDGFLAAKPELVRRLQGLRRQAKAALLDQRVIAGVGNIYADESLFRAGIHPLQPLTTLSNAALARLVDAVQSVLSAAVHAGGSTLRDYVDANSQPGSFQELHVVYGRAGMACPECGRPLDGFQAAGRTTVACRHCQPLIHTSGR